LGGRPKTVKVKKLTVRKPKFWPRKNGHINRMDSKTKVSYVFYNNPQGSRLRGRRKPDCGNGHRQILINAKLQIGKRSQKRELPGRSTSRRRRSASECSVIKKKKMKKKKKKMMIMMMIKMKNKNKKKKKKKQKMMMMMKKKKKKKKKK